MKSKRTIKAKELVADIRSGMSSEHLIDKYRVSHNTLNHLLRQLLHAGAIEKEELELQFLRPRDSAIDQRRNSVRRYVFVPLPIFDLKDLLKKGSVTEISRKGFQTLGIPATKEDTKEFLLQPDYFVDVYPFVLEAQCVWSSYGNTDKIRAGFQITSISDECLMEMKKIVSMLTISN